MISILFFIALLYYLKLLICANVKNKVKINYGGSVIEIREGDILKEFDNDDSFRVFAFNEYFDTEVDDKIIAEKTLNGKILKYLNETDEINHRMEEDSNLNENIKNKNVKRKYGKKTQYNLGTIFKYKNMFFTAMTHFDNQNRAYLSIQDYIRFLINFWDEINKYYANKTVVIPLLGSGITRIDNYSYSDEQILKLILLTFKIRRIKFKMPAKLVILLNSHTNKRINYFTLEDDFNGL
ncbi:DUF6430 domain-containing protein [Fructilactobacillus cliffordii]|uniref:macro domain-containing protein n=1 Tax=Fructilactobacillus cliffordii TaxID=2940299 RepID=UPI0020928248|nr:macro domain-containing protein [Fructilactobacillus cliffordii]USS86183.1 DUF6430 domain-containing protein [Fructilactobacillus cliffordii]